MSERNIGDEIIEGLTNAIDYAEGDDSKGRESVVEIPNFDIKAIRKRQNMTQRDFARTYGFKLSALRNWEQGRRRPDRSARLLLAIIDREPKVIRDVIDEFDRDQARQ